MQTLFREAEGHIMEDEKCEPTMNPAQSETPGMSGNGAPSGPRENWEAPLASGSSTPDRLEKATSYTTSTHAGGESDSAVLPAKCPNKGAVWPAEGMEGRALAKKNQRLACTCRTLRRSNV